MNSNDILNQLEDKKNNMFNYVGQMGTLKNGFTREQAKTVFTQIEIVKNAINTRYRIFNNSNVPVSIGDYLLSLIENGYNKFEIVGKRKDIRLYKPNKNCFPVLDKTGKQFLMLCIELGFITSL